MTKVRREKGRDSETREVHVRGEAREKRVNGCNYK